MKPLRYGCPPGSSTAIRMDNYPTEIVDCPHCHGMGEVEDDLWVWTRCYTCYGVGEVEVCAYCLDSGEACEACGVRE